MKSQIRQVIFIATLVILPRIVFAEISLICPCGALNSGLTAITITAGVSNNEDTTSGDLRILLGTSPVFPIGERYINAYGYYSGPLISGGEHPQGTKITTAFGLPTNLSDQGTAIVILDLQELVDGQWITQDSVRLNPELEFPKPEVGGESVNGVSGAAIHFVGTPSIELLGNGQATVHIQRIVNSSREEIIIDTVNVGHFGSEEFWGQPYRNGANITVNLTMPAMSSMDNVEFTEDYTAATSDVPFSHIFLGAAGGVVVWQTIETMDGLPMPTRNLVANSIDFIEDSDGDGVSDHNESIAGTDPVDPESRTDSLTLDVMALYTTGAAQMYLDEPLARIIHQMEWANQAFSNSGIEAKLRLVGFQETNYQESTNLLTALRALQTQTGVFDGIDSARELAGADLITLFLEDDPDDGVCGFAIQAGDNKDGDFGFTKRSDVVSVVAANCSTKAMTHELGHNLGLGHSIRDEVDGGTYTWSRGYGIDTDFVTIMANQTNYNVSGPDLQYFSTPIKQCGSQPCGVDKLDASLGADAALSIRTTMYQVSELSGFPPDFDADGMIDFEDGDDDNDGFADGDDAFPFDSSEWVDTDNDGVGNNLDSDDDGDGLRDQLDWFPLDATKTGVIQDPDISNSYLGRSYHMTNSQSPNVSETHIINSSGSAQAFTGTLYHKSGVQLGAANVSLHAGAINSQGRVVLSATDLQALFNVEPWTGPAILDINSGLEFDVMSKLARNGRVTNTNCVRSGNAHNVEGSDSTDIAYVRFINDGFTPIADIRGTLYDADGNIIGSPDALFFAELGSREAIFKSQGSIRNIIGADWSGQASLVLSATYDDLRLMNLNYVNNEIYFNFSCYLKASDQSGN